MGIKRTPAGAEQKPRRSLPTRRAILSVAPSPPPVTRITQRRQPPLSITAMLSFYEETGPELGVVIPTLAGLADKLLAYDGAYEGTENGEPKSSPEVRKRIRQLAKAVELPVEIVTRDTLWMGEVEKRATMLKHAVRDASWVFPVDSDWAFFGDRAKTRKYLGSCSADVVTVPMFTPPLSDETLMSRKAPHRWHSWVAAQTVNYPVFYYVQRGLRIETRHWWWFIGYGKDKRAVTGGPDGPHPDVLRDQIPTNLQIEHRCFYRDPAYCKTRRKFYERRDANVAETGVEL